MRSSPPRYTIEEMIQMIDEPNRSACFRIINENRKLFQTVQGSTNNHQAWPGGYWDHVEEIMNIGIQQFELASSIQGEELDFSLSDVLIVTFLHDIEKPWKYELGEDGRLHIIESLATKQAQHEFKVKKLAEYGVVLTDQQLNGIKYAEGELNDYSSKHRVMNSLAVLCHIADVFSARLRYNNPLEKNDPWIGAKRHQN